MTQKLPLPITPTELQTRISCMYHRHDFGLLTEKEQETEMFWMREHWRAIYKTLEDEAFRDKTVPIPVFSPPTVEDVDGLKRCWVGYKKSSSEYWTWRFTDKICDLDTHWMPFNTEFLPTK